MGRRLVKKDKKEEEMVRAQVSIVASVVTWNKIITSL